MLPFSQLVACINSLAPLRRAQADPCIHSARASDRNSLDSRCGARGHKHHIKLNRLEGCIRPPDALSILRIEFAGVPS